MSERDRKYQQSKKGRASEKRRESTDYRAGYRAGYKTGLRKGKK